MWGLAERKLASKQSYMYYFDLSCTCFWGVCNKQHYLSTKTSCFNMIKEETYAKERDTHERS